MPRLSPKDAVKKVLKKMDERGRGVIFVHFDARPDVLASLMRLNRRKRKRLRFVLLRQGYGFIEEMSQ